MSLRLSLARLFRGFRRNTTESNSSDSFLSHNCSCPHCSSSLELRYVDGYSAYIPGGKYGVRWLAEKDNGQVHLIGLCPACGQNVQATVSDKG